MDTGRVPGSVSMVVDLADGPRLHRPSTKHGVEQRSEHVDGCSDVEDHLPFCNGVLHAREDEKARMNTPGRRSSGQIQQI